MARKKKKERRKDVKNGFYYRGNKKARRDLKRDRQRKSTHKPPKGRPYEGDSRTVKPNATVKVRAYDRKIKVGKKTKTVHVREHTRKIYKKGGSIIIK